MSKKNSGKTIENETHDLSACSEVLPPTALLRAPMRDLDSMETRLVARRVVCIPSQTIRTRIHSGLDCNTMLNSFILYIFTVTGSCLHFTQHKNRFLFLQYPTFYNYYETLHRLEKEFKIKKNWNLDINFKN
jgi:hypothetical protein